VRLGVNGEIDGGGSGFSSVQHTHFSAIETNYNRALRDVMIRIWKLKDAPQSIQALRPPGTDATWVLEAPGSMRGDVERILKSRGRSIRKISYHELPNGSFVVFGQPALVRTFKASIGKA
jgi:hypothetical protein